MKLVCAQSDLSANLALLSRVVPSKPTHPVYANVLLQAEPDRLGLSVFDLSLGMQIWIPAQTEVPGSFTLPARFFNDIVSRLPNAPITIAVESPTVTLACGAGHYQMQGLEAEEFTALPDLSESESLHLPSSLLLEGLQATLFASSTDEAKQMLTGLHMSLQTDGLEFAATDGHRLAVAHGQPEEFSPDTPLSVTVPAKALRELERMLGRTPVALTLRCDQTQVVFEFATEQGMARLSSRLLEGSYPNYKQLLPRQFERQVTVERQPFLAGLERIAVLAMQKNNVVKIKLDAVNQQLDVSAEAPQFGSGEESLPAQISGTDLEVAFNVKYLIDGLKAMTASEVQIQMNAATAPVILSPLSGTKMTYLIMPIQLRG